MSSSILLLGVSYLLLYEIAWQGTAKATGCFGNMVAVYKSRSPFTATVFGSNPEVATNVLPFMV